MITYKVSYVVIGGEHPGAIVNELARPEVGGQVKIGKSTFEIVEIYEVMPMRGDFAFLHATVRPVKLPVGKPDATVS
ncbi:MAG TPA: hypothetical protein VHP83_25020 [Aggregatilineaceae bacterium]|nr:hypothetical protein [Aggregatilineaceae bacterium]